MIKSPLRTVFFFSTDKNNFRHWNQALVTKDAMSDKEHLLSLLSLNLISSSASSNIKYKIWFCDQAKFIVILSVRQFSDLSFCFIINCLVWPHPPHKEQQLECQTLLSPGSLASTCQALGENWKTETRNLINQNKYGSIMKKGYVMSKDSEIYVGFGPICHHGVIFMPARAY